MTKLIAALLLTLLPTLASAQADIIATNRKLDWTQAGVQGGIPYRTRICANVTTSNTLAQINSAIAGCAAHQVVQFGCGTYNLSGGIVVQVDNVTLRGGANQCSILMFSSDNSCGGLGGNICIRANTLNDLDSPGNTTNWTAGYSKGTTVVTLASVTNLSVGSPIIFDRINDSNTDNGVIWVCRTANICCQDCGSPSRNAGGLRTQSETHIVTAINGTNVTIFPAIAWPNYASGATDPEAWYPTNAPARVGVGIEGFTIDTESGTGGSSIFVYNARNIWIKGNRMLHVGNKAIWIYQSVGVEVLQNYIYDKRGADNTQEGSESYGPNSYISSMYYFHDNIIHHITSPTQCEAGYGGVTAYNYSFDDFYNLTSPEWAQASAYTHGTCGYSLHEGNDGFGMIQDIVHSQNYFHTGFRNRWWGFESGKEAQTVAVNIYGANRYSNIVGNVLGDNAYHTQYESRPGAAGASCEHAIYAIGWGGNCGGSGGGIADVSGNVNTLMRWGNYDTVNDASRFQSGEVPSGDANYPNSVPGDNVLPASFFLTKPPMGWGTTTQWPAIGPEITGGDLSGVSGRAYSIPAKKCYDNGSKTGVVLNTDPQSCFVVTAPQNLQ